MDIVFEQIDEKYAYGQYGEFKVIIMKKNSYINATKMCNENNKQMCHWFENKMNKELINEVKKDINQLKSSSIGKPMDGTFDDIITNNATIEPIILIKGGGNVFIRGTYVHPLLIPHIASWISPVFAIKVSKIVNEFLVNEYKDKLYENEQIIVEKDNKIDSLEQMMKRMEKKMELNNKIANEKLDNVLKDNKITHRELKYTREQLDETKEQLDETDSKLDHADKTIVDIATKLNISVERRVPKAKTSRTIEHFVVMRQNPKSRYYYIIRGQQAHVNLKINEYTDTYPDSIEFLKIEDIPHAINLGIRIKETFGCQIQCKYNDITLRKQNEIYDEKISALSSFSFKKKIIKIFDERKKI